MTNPSAPTPARSSATELMLMCRVVGEMLAVPIGLVQEVTPAMALASPAATTGRVLGYLDLRGVTLEVVDGRELFGAPGKPLEVSDRFLVLRHDGWLVALRVDAVDGIEHVDPVTTSASPEHGDGLLRPGRMAGKDRSVVQILDDAAAVRFVSALLGHDRLS